MDEEMTWTIFVYKLTQEKPEMETMQYDFEGISAASYITLPAREYEGLWESLHYENNIKTNVRFPQFILCSATQKNHWFCS